MDYFESVESRREACTRCAQILAVHKNKSEQQHYLPVFNTVYYTQSVFIFLANRELIALPKS